jgi:4'-phosphopantetheinyl transferase EntD
MSDQEANFVAAWESILPRGVQVEAGAFLHELRPLGGRELAAAVGMDADRQREFKNGRTYAKRALTAFGLPDAELPIGNNRAPIWPEGYIGSITHVRRGPDGVCAAAVARATDFVALGIDVEYATGLPARTWPALLTASELDQVCHTAVSERESEVIRRWCVKEAAAKASLLPLDFLCIDTKLIEVNATGRYYLAAKADQSQQWRAGTTISNGLILAAVAVPKVS